jgi:hypothetical protein
MQRYAGQRYVAPRSTALTVDSASAPGRAIEP